jgi:uncharacterized Tic20 family protein
MESTLELIFGIISEFITYYILSPIALLVFFTGAFLIWLYNKRKLTFAHFIDKKDEDKVLHNYQVGCAFYIFIFILWMILFKC